MIIKGPICSSFLSILCKMFFFSHHWGQKRIFDTHTPSPFQVHWLSWRNQRTLQVDPIILYCQFGLQSWHLWEGYVPRLRELQSFFGVPIQFLDRGSPRKWSFCQNQFYCCPKLHCFLSRSLMRCFLINVFLAFLALQSAKSTLETSLLTMRIRRAPSLLSERNASP